MHYSATESGDTEALIMAQTGRLVDTKKGGFLNVA